MSKYYIISTLILLSCNTSLAQFLWLEGQEESKIIEHVAGHKMEVLPSDKYLNHHPLFRLEQPMDKVLPLISSGLTVFTVSFDDDKGAEELIWKVHQGDHDKILHTTMRTANMIDGQFLNYTVEGRDNARLTTYYLNQPILQNTKFQLGNIPSNSDIPVQKFSGYFGEIIAFEKVLSPLSIQIVQTILALKYNLTLPSDHHYLGLHGESLRYSENNTFQHHVGGIGRLDELHFDQSISTTDLNQGSFTINTEDHVFDDNSFVLWADDGNALKYNESNGVKTLNRTWQIRNIRNKDPKVRITLKHTDIIDDISENESFYGIVKSEDEIVIYPLQKTEQNTITGHVAIQQEKTTFQVARAPSFWSYLQISEPSCDKTLEGTISGQIIGGQAPYHIVVEHDEDKTTSFISDKNSFDHNITTGGEYKLTIADKNHQKWQTNLIINYKDIPKPDLSNVYYKTEENIHITPYYPISHDIHLEWILPDGRHQFSDNLKPSQSGNYTLKVNNGSCENRFDFELINNASNIIDARVFPNPSASFRQYLTANLEEAAPYRITITSQDGRLIVSEDFQASQYIFQEFSLDAGIYIIALHVGNAVSSHPLIVLQN